MLALYPYTNLVSSKAVKHQPLCVRRHCSSEEIMTSFSLYYSWWVQASVKGSLFQSHLKRLHQSSLYTRTINRRRLFCAQRQRLNFQQPMNLNIAWMYIDQFYNRNITGLKLRCFCCFLMSVLPNFCFGKHRYFSLKQSLIVWQVLKLSFIRHILALTWPIVLDVTSILIGGR